MSLLPPTVCVMPIPWPRVAPVAPGTVRRLPGAGKAVMVTWATKGSVMPAGTPLPSSQLPAAVELPTKDKVFLGVVLVVVAAAARVGAMGAQPSAAARAVVPLLLSVKKGEFV